MPADKKTLSKEEQEELLRILEARFNDHPHRHEQINWLDLVTKLENKVEKLWSLNEMEKTGGEPDVIGYDSETGEYIFCDCSKESPKGRRSVCYDQAALEARKKHKPDNSALQMAQEMGIEILTRDQYEQLQTLEEFDTKCSSWIKTPKSIRDLGGALFCDRRYNTVFLYHNSAESYYASRGFRGILKV